MPSSSCFCGWQISENYDGTCAADVARFGCYVFSSLSSRRGQYKYLNFQSETLQ